MNDDADVEYFQAESVISRPRATLVRLTAAHRTHASGEKPEFWIPNSLFEWHRNGTIVVEAWFANKEGMNG